MGCDIHMMVEVKEGGRWRLNTDPVFYGYRKKEPSATSPDENRDYSWFSIIANVRNYEERGPLPYIAAPRGVPADSTEEYKADVEREGCDGHSHTWLRSEDFASFNWDAAKNPWGWDFYKETVVRPLAFLSEKYEDARLVFFFDN